MSDVRCRTVLVMVECRATLAAALDVAAEQWAQEMRYRCEVAGATTTGAVSVVVDGSLDVLADAFALAREKVSQ